MNAGLRTAISEILVRHDLVSPGEDLRFEEIPAGVSSQLWLVKSGSRCFVAKQPLALLRSASEWRAPMKRGYFENLWLEHARPLVGELVPEVLAYDADRRILIMSYYDQDRYRTLKQLYLAGDIRVDCATGVGAALGKLHSGFAANPASMSEFYARDVLLATRIDPYFAATAARHPDLAQRIDSLAEHLLRSEDTVIHGDVSPKNILVGPISPVILDAECACIGDPAFDVAFFLTHLLLKCVIGPRRAQKLTRSALAFYEAYLENANPELGKTARANTGLYLGVFLLARVDGKSPVEYLTDPRHREFVRGEARALISSGNRELPQVILGWEKAVNSDACLPH